MILITQPNCLLSSNNVHCCLLSSLSLSLSLSLSPSYQRQLLHECGIGTNESNLEQEACLGGAVVSQHRVLLFCQYKTMLDIIEKDLLK